MLSSVGKIFGNIRTNYSNPINKIDAVQAQNFIQASVSSENDYNLYKPAQKNSTPYGDSPRAQTLDILA